MFNLTGNQEKCKLKPIFQSYTEETIVYFEEIDLKNQQIVLLMATMTRREKYIFFDIICGLFFFLASFTTSIFTINSSGTDSKGVIIKACQKIMCAAV